MNRLFHLAVSAAVLSLSIFVIGCTKPPEPAMSSTPTAAAGNNVSDADVTEHVKTALLKAESLKSADITVVTTKGDVRLTGTLANQAQVDEAIKVARAAEGVHAIHDELTIVK